MRSFAIDDALLHQHEFGFISTAGANMAKVLKDLVAVAVLLVTKLIAGKSQDNELLAELIGKCVHLGVIPGSCASQRGDVLDEDSFALEHVHLQLGSRKSAASQSLRRQVVERLEGGPSQEHHNSIFYF